ncbi:alpha/beta hydrolase [Aestuariicella hydrocarbonica]|uniref:Alpha/beta hydrolase n=1 Tax=Pseudomaricurvus hydrocarbonicus TaxID=1470433 RepID=A0A9E5MQ41_9GAMM|nr:alpha/beta hydrolase [Aestuariicella hydrocarbonica]NHO68351.1 alpha/beta hydrolase [Aestuariicella hydrocarbonica]
MTPTFESLQQLAADLPQLDFSLCTDQTAWLKSSPVQDYLNHYHINFTTEGLCRKHLLGKFAAAGFDIAAHLWLPSLQSADEVAKRTVTAKGTIFLVHGFTDSVGLMQHAIRFLLQQGWNVVAFDLPGHGLSSGVQASIESFDQYREVLQTCLDHCRQHMPKPWHGVGQSTGGSVWLNYVATFPNQSAIDKVLLLAPLIRPKGWGTARWFFPVVKLFTGQLTRKYNLTSHDEDFLDFVRHRDPLQARITPLRWASAMEEWVQNFQVYPVQQRPLKIIQGDADTTVDFKYNVDAICATFPNTKVVMIPNARHQLVNESAAFRKKVFSHVLNWLDLKS